MTDVEILIAVLGLAALGTFLSRRTRTTRRPRRGSRQSTVRRAPTPSAYPGDYTGRVDITYSPKADGSPDPGEVVWTWVPFEEDHSQGKDRPVLLIGADGPWLLGLQLTSKDHDLDAAQEARWGRYWMDIGTGAWDRSRRPSEVRLDRILRVDPSKVRREGATLDRSMFSAVAKSLSDHHRW